MEEKSSDWSQEEREYLDPTVLTSKRKTSKRQQNIFGEKIKFNNVPSFDNPGYGV